MRHPLDHDGDGRPGGSLPRKRGRPAKVKPDAEQAETQTQAETRLKVLKADAIHDGEGGFLPVGAVFVPADEAAAEALIARGLAE